MQNQQAAREYESDGAEDTSVTHVTDGGGAGGDDDRRLRLPCEIISCAHTAAEIADHPQRGAFRACHIHVVEIEQLPAWRWIGGGPGS